MQKPCAAAISIEVKGLNLSINGQNLLKEVSFAVAAGEFIAIVGEVGSGKSLLVLSLVAETGAQFERFRAGDVDLTPLEPNLRRRWFAFVPQEGFVMSASLRENVASHYEVDRSLDASIQRSLGLSQLSLETEQVRDGLDTEIGERGVNLSGGQKQRVSLARAHFFDRPVVLLDDCLSAVDVDTERRLVEELIDGAWAGRTRILVTHRLSVLERVDRVFFMEAGRIVEVGTFKELMMTSKRMNDFVASVQRSEAQRQNIESQEVSSKAEGVVSLSGESEFESTDLERMGDVEAESVS
jgi:ABC-type multidrug transport system fused ATPase/permease subunit